MSTAALVCLVAMTSAPAQAPHVGHATFYRPGLMQKVAAKRHLPQVEHMAALTGPGSCGYIGRWVSARVAGHLARFLIVDCSQYRDALRHQRTGLVLEVGYRDAVRWGFVRVGRAAASVWWPR